MEPILFFGNEVLTVIFISMAIFISRIIDVSLGTMRVIYISKGRKFLAPMLGFFEVLIWVIVVQHIISNLTNIFYYLAYASGFSAGTFIGMLIEETYSNGKYMLQIITKRDSYELEKKLQELECKMTTVDGMGINYEKDTQQNVKIFFIIAKKKKIQQIIELLRVMDPNAEYSIKDVRYATEDHPEIVPKSKKHLIKFGFFRKSK